MKFDFTGYILGLCVVVVILLLFAISYVIFYFELPFYTLWIIIIGGFLFHLCATLILYSIEKDLAEEKIKLYPKAVTLLIDVSEREDNLIKTFKRVMILKFRSKERWEKEERELNAIINK